MTGACKKEARPFTSEGETSSAALWNDELGVLKKWPEEQFLNELLVSTLEHSKHSFAVGTVGSR